MEYIALAFNVGIVGVAVQLLKWKVLPVLKEKYPYLLPIIAMVIGTASAWVMAQTGIDISPIGAVFNGMVSGALAVTGFNIAKETQNTAKGIQ